MKLLLILLIAGCATVDGNDNSWPVWTEGGLEPARAHCLRVDNDWEVIAFHEDGGDNTIFPVTCADLLEHLRVLDQVDERA